MSFNRRAFLTLGAGALVFAGCAPYRRTVRGDAPPPPLRPAPGYRYVYPDGVTLIYDDSLALYVVYGWPSYYFYDGWFYYFDGIVWWICRDFNGPYRQTAVNGLPPGLQRLHAKGGMPAGPKPRGKGPGR